MKKGALLFPGIPEMELVRKRLIVQYWKETTAVTYLLQCWSLNRSQYLSTFLLTDSHS